MKDPWDVLLTWNAPLFTLNVMSLSVISDVSESTGAVQLCQYHCESSGSWDEYGHCADQERWALLLRARQLCIYWNAFNCFADVEEIIGHTDTKIISDAQLGILLRQMALHADVRTLSTSISCAFIFIFHSGNVSFLLSWLRQLCRSKRATLGIHMPQTGWNDCAKSSESGQRSSRRLLRALKVKDSPQQLPNSLRLLLSPKTSQTLFKLPSVDHQYYHISLGIAPFLRLPLCMKFPYLLMMSPVFMIQSFSINGLNAGALIGNLKAWNIVFNLTFQRSVLFRNLSSFHGCFTRLHASGDMSLIDRCAFPLF